MENIIVRIPGKIYAKAFQEGWLNSLGLYVFLCKSHSGKTYYFGANQKTKMLKNLADKHNISLTAFMKHIKTLKENGLLSFSKYEMKLTKNSELFRIKKKRVFVPANINSFKEIKFFLQTIPIITNIVKQEKAVKRIQHYNYQKEQSKKASGDIKVKGYNSLRRYEKNGGKMEFNSNIQLSVSKMGELIDRKNKNTITKYKRFLREKGIINVFNEKIKLLKYKISFNQFIELKKYNVIDNRSYFYRGMVYHCIPSNIQVAYRQRPTL